MFSRWSRRKLEADHAAAETDAPPDQDAANAQTEPLTELEATQPAEPDAPSTELPTLDELGPDSDFRGFMRSDVDDDLRRSALKKLFSDPHFNIADGLDVYAEDYTKLETLSPAMLAGLKHAQRLLFDDPDDGTQGDTQSETNVVESLPAAEPARLPHENQTVRMDPQVTGKQAVNADESTQGAQGESTDPKPGVTTVTPTV